MPSSTSSSLLVFGVVACGDENILMTVSTHAGIPITTLTYATRRLVPGLSFRYLRHFGRKNITMLRNPWRGSSRFKTILKAGTVVSGVKRMITGMIQQRKKEPV